VETEATNYGGQMKKDSKCFLWTTFLALVCAFAAAVQAERSAPPESAKDARVRAGLNALGIGEDYQIVVADDRDLVEDTAAQVMHQFLAKASLTVGIVPESETEAGKKRILLGRESNLRALKDLGDKGKVNIRTVSAEDDGFHLKQIGDDFVVAGANPNGVLYGVYAFEDFVNAGANGNLDIRRVPYFRKRGSAPEYYWNPINSTTEDLPEAKAAYLSRMGVNQWTDQGSGGGGLNDFVTSDLFPFQDPPKADYQRKIRLMASLCKKYGIDFYPFLNEPVLPSMAGDLSKYPQETLGTVKRPWGGGENGIERTLCVSSPLVQQNLQNMMRKFVREYPDVKGVQLYNMDISAWLCTPELCDRCKATCKDSPANAFNPWETQAKLATLLAEAAHDENPDFDFRFWGAIHYHGAHFEKMIHAAKGYSSLISAWTGSDRTVMVPAAAILDPAFTVSRQVCEEQSLPLYMVCETNNLEMIPRSLPFPFDVCNALKQYKDWGVKYIEEGAGPVPDHNTINALVTREFQWNPEQNPEKFLAELSVRQFGKTSGKLMYRAWKEMEKAFHVWDDAESVPFPLAGSQFHLSMGTLFGVPPAIVPDIVDYYDNIIGILTNVEPWLAEGYQEYKTRDFLEKVNSMNRHFARAAGHAEKAVAAASDREFIDIYYYDAAGGRPTCKEYAELNYAPMAIAEAVCTQRCNMIHAYILLAELKQARTAGDEKSAAKTEDRYHELIREDIGVQERFRTLLGGFAQMQPCYTRTTLMDKEIADLVSVTTEKIAKLNEFVTAASASAEN